MENTCCDITDEGGGKCCTCFPTAESSQDVSVALSSVCQVQIASSDLIGREQKGVGTLETNQLGRLSSSTYLISCLWPETGHCCHDDDDDDDDEQEPKCRPRDSYTTD